MNETTRLTAERLAEIGKMLEGIDHFRTMASVMNPDIFPLNRPEAPVTVALRDLLAEVERLRASAETAAGEQAAQVDSAPHCDYCSQPWTVQAWRVNMDVREWLCATHFDDLSSDRLYRIERDRRSEQEEVLYSDEEAEAAYHSYEDDVFGEQAQGEA